MKKLFGVIFFVLIIFLGFQYRNDILQEVNKIIYISPCDTPIAYRLGTIDPQFNVTSNEYMQDIQKASDIWSSAYGKNLFVYNKNANLVINLIYDTRQGLNNQINQIENNLQEQDSTIKPKMVQYEAQVADFNKRLSEFKQQVNYWNSRGGAPPDVYQKLKNDQETLKAEANRLDKEAGMLNLSTSQYNSQVKQLNQTINVFNQALESKPEEGLYVLDNSGQRIDIYFYKSHEETVHTLAHEMGHALGIGHIENNENDLMYSKTNEAVTLSSIDISELQRVCRKRSIFEILENRLLVVYDRLSKIQIRN